MATQKTRLGKLDFDDIKASIKNYLSQQTEFLDYNFEGSNMAQLINLLAYNSHYDALAANFLANEVFLDTATKRSSVVSRAKELGYTPRSRRASTTTLTVSLRNISNEGVVESLVLPRGSRFTASVNDETFTFTTREAAYLPKIIEGGSPVFRGTVQVYEGILVQQTVTYKSIDNTVSIPNVDVDTTTLKVEVLEEGEWKEYSQPKNFLTVISSSRVYMLQEGFNGFEIYFGDGTLGKRPTDMSQIRMTYVVTSGDTANGASVFSLASNVDGMLSNTITTISASGASSGGQLEESIESIRLNAKNTFGSQNRAVNASDYAALAIQNFASVKDVLAWDGSDNVPPKFGKVVLCVQPAVGDVLSQTQKTLIADFLQRKGVGNIKVDFVDPEYINVEVRSKVKYDINNLQVGTFELEFIVRATITEYTKTVAQKFKGTIRYSNMLSTIDDSNYAITGNETTLMLAKYLKPNLFTGNNFRFSFANQISSGSIVSSGFYDGVSSNKLYLKDSDGSINVYYSMNGSDVLYQSAVGTINYVTGETVISNLSMASLDGLKFKINAEPLEQDIYSTKNIILFISQENIKVEMVKDNTQ